MADPDIVLDCLHLARGDHVSEVDLLFAIGEPRITGAALDCLATATVALRLRGINLNYQMGRGWALMR